jgi:predicted ribosomally synthesized peptide with SipW-like signal peptide
MKKILGLGIAAILVMAMVGGGTWAFFSDVEQSADNVFAAGTLDLGLSNTSDTSATGSTTATFSASTWKPGDATEGTIYVNNNGSIDISALSVNFTYNPVDYSGRPSTISGSPWTTDPTDFFDKMITATEATWNSSNITEIIGQSLYDLKNAGNISLPEGLPAHTQYLLVITWTFESEATNGCQGASVNMTVNVTGVQ